MSYEVKLEAFEGPLDLLLHLIHRLEIDIYDIPMAELTAQYMGHIHTMQVLELNEASEYLVMAATLLAIKSKMLLPIYEGELTEEEFEIEEQDPRDELVARLIEYRKYKEAALNLKELETSRTHYFTRPPTDLSALMPEEQLALFDASVNVYDMVAAFQKMLNRKRLKAPLSTKITKQDITIKAQMKSVINVLKFSNGRADFFDLFPSDDRETLVITFLSLLELMKRQIVGIEQLNNFADLTVILRKEEITDEQLESIDE
ncbi:segregation/condensation protein A [Rummeliibacillus stabekisii]|uniref:Segregation and condensation protein A n=1 Tax=Rummeliibacillus stabekisii TaxID=241244 RepID=A0A143HA40_9BACL|nr:segregation/condensation protein A [Rummeliibacillus stabekisii]AMW98603.1 segregation and condensation protein A [Rummeliibacillus stabekisii]